MGNTKEVKQVRSQLRQLAKELLPEALASEVHTAHYNQLKREITGKLTEIQAQINDVVTRVDERSKEMQSFFMRQVMEASAAKAPEVAKNTPTEA